MDSSSVRPNRLKGKWSNFGLRAFFVAVTLIAGFCGGWTTCDLFREMQTIEESDRVAKRLQPVLTDLQVASDTLSRQMSTNLRIEEKVDSLLKK